MKKHMTIAALLAAGSAFANAAYEVTLDDTYYTNPNAWVYVWTGKGADNNWGTGANWSYYENASDGAPASGNNQKPVSADPAFIGYDFTYENGKQTLSANGNAVTVTVPSRMDSSTNEYDRNFSNQVFLGNNVTLSGTSNLFKQSQSFTFNFGDFSGTSTISMGDFWMQTDATVNFAGEIQMTESVFSYNVFTATKMEQIAGTWNASAVAVTDKNGNALTYADEESEIGKAGYYWLESSGNKGGKWSLSLKAMAIPEPSTFGLLAGLGALALVGARRRRK